MMDRKLRPDLLTIADISAGKVRVYLEKEVESAELWKWLKTYDVAVTSERRNAMVFITPTPPKLSSKRSQWWAVVNGAWVFSPGFLLGEGVVVKYAAAKQTVRFVWMSQHVKEKHEQVSQIIEETCHKKMVGSKWTLVDGNEEAFNEKVAKCNKAHRSCSIVGIVGAKENKDGPTLFAPAYQLCKKPLGKPS